jgi:hypothetical protein
MNHENATKRCGHASCTCHTQEGAAYCSESCRQASERMSASASEHCDCGHAGCTASEYTPSASDE